MNILRSPRPKIGLITPHHDGSEINSKRSTDLQPYESHTTPPRTTSEPRYTVDQKPIWTIDAIHNGEVVDTIEVSLHEPKNSEKIVTVTSQSHQIADVESRFTRNSHGNWIPVDSAKNIRDFENLLGASVSIPSNISDQEIALGVLSSYIGSLIIQSKIEDKQQYHPSSRATRNRRSVDQASTSSGQTYENHIHPLFAKRAASTSSSDWEPGGYEERCCVDHDMQCTDSPDAFRWTMLACPGYFYVDINECCFQHDIDMWCGAPLGEIGRYGDIGLAAAHASVKLFQCIYQKFIDSVVDSPWYCDIFAIPTSHALGISIGTTYFLATFVIHLAISEFGPRIHLWGEKDHCCVCGGNRPTTCCGGWQQGGRGRCGNQVAGAINLCNPDESCYKCRIGCVYDENMQFVRKIRDNHSTMPCCGEPVDRDCPRTYRSTQQIIGGYGAFSGDYERVERKDRNGKRSYNVVWIK